MKVKFVSPKKIWSHIRRRPLILVVLLALIFASSLFAASALAVNQNAYRWRLDDGSQTTATWEAAENMSVTIEHEQVRRLRFGAANSGTEPVFQMAAGSPLPLGTQSANGAAYDPTTGYYYVGITVTSGVGSIIRVRTSDMSLQGTLPLAAGELSPNHMEIDPAGGFLYVGLRNTAKVVKIRLSDFTRVATLTFGSGCLAIHHSSMDAPGGYLYFGSMGASSPWTQSIVCKVRLSDFAHVATGYVGPSPNSRFADFAVSQTSNYGYVTANYSTTLYMCRFRKSDMVNEGCVGRVTTDQCLSAITVDDAHGVVYAFSRSGYPTSYNGRACKFDSTTRNILSSGALSGGWGGIGTADIDLENGYLYVGDAVGTGSNIFRVRTSDMTQVGHIATGQFSYWMGPYGNLSFDPKTNEVFVVSGADCAGLPSLCPSKAAKFKVSPDWSFRLEYAPKLTTCAAASGWTQVPAVATTQPWEMYNTGNLSDGAASIDSPGVSNGKTVFVPGQVKDASAQTAKIALGENEFTEHEFSVRSTLNAPNGQEYCFRLSDNGSATNINYQQYAQVRVFTDFDPIVTSSASVPDEPATNEAVTIAGTATDDFGVTSIELYLDGTAPINLVKTCDFSPALTPAACSQGVGKLLFGAHSLTVKAFDASGQTDSETVAFSVVNAVPIIDSLTPSQIPAGSPDTIVTILGDGFISGSVAYVDGSSRITTYVSENELTMLLPSADLYVIGILGITVFNPAPGGGYSNSRDLTVTPFGTQESGNVTGFAWSATAGWISLSCANFGTCAVSGYGLEIADVEGATSPRRAKFGGHAWSSTLGWLCFGETCGGTTPEGGASYAEWRDYVPAGGGAACSADADCGINESCVAALGNRCARASQFYGWAKVISMGDDGWLSLNCWNDSGDSCGVSNYYVAYENGRLTRSIPVGDPDADNYHWGWGGNSLGTGLGWVDFSPAYANWSPPAIGRIWRPEGIFEPENSTIPGTHPAAFEVEVTGVHAGAYYRLECDLLRADGTRGVTGVNFGDTAKFGETVMLPYVITQAEAVSGIVQNRTWLIDDCRIASRPTATACATDGECGANGICDESVSFCRMVVLKSDQRQPLYVHQNQWTKFQANEDYYQAIKCWAGFPDEYLENSTYCDFTGDASFSLAMSKGIPIKRDCVGRGATPDCSDRFCSGISYFCPATPPRRPTLCDPSDPSPTIPHCSAVGYEIGDVCCSNQPYVNGAVFNNVVRGMECRHGDATDGYFDCSCASASYGAGDCWAPGAQAGELCCMPGDLVIKL